MILISDILEVNSGISSLQMNVCSYFVLQLGRKNFWKISILAACVHNVLLIMRLQHLTENQ